MAMEDLITLFGILGNISSFLVFLSPILTFIRIYRQKSTLEYDASPYIVGFFSSALWLYYALLDMTSLMVVSINAFGCIIEMVYIIMYIIYAKKNIKIYTAKLLAIAIGIFVIIFMATIFIPNGNRVTVVGYICDFLSIMVFASPLRIVCEVLRTRSVEYMPFWLSFFLTVCASTWFAYGLCKKDWVVVVPNFIGMLLGVIQITIYVIIRNLACTKHEGDENGERRNPAPTQV